MAKLKKLLLFVLGGAVLGWLVSILLALKFVGWTYTNRVDTIANCKCAELVSEIKGEVISMQLICMGLGVIAFIVLGVVYLRRQKQKAEASPPAASSGAGT
jgi:hypothetical protein